MGSISQYSSHSEVITMTQCDKFGLGLGSGLAYGYGTVPNRSHRRRSAITISSAVRTSPHFRKQVVNLPMAMCCTHLQKLGSLARQILQQSTPWQDTADCRTKQFITHCITARTLSLIVLFTNSAHVTYTYPWR